MAAQLMAGAIRRGLHRGSMAPAGSILLARRGLGDTVRGPQVTDLAGNYRVAEEFFSKGAISYAEYKQQCMSLRLFAFAALTVGIVTDLAVDPPKSSYWSTFGPMYCASYIAGCFSNSSPPIFLTSKGDTNAGVAPAAVRAAQGFAPEPAAAADPEEAAVYVRLLLRRIEKLEKRITGGSTCNVRKSISLKGLVHDRSADGAAAEEETTDEAALYMRLLLRRIEGLEGNLKQQEEAQAAAAKSEGEAQAAAGSHDLVAAGSAKHAAFVFIKPHAVNDKVKYLMELKLKCSGISVVSEGSIPAERIDKEQLIDFHYGAIAAKAVKLKPETLTVQPKAQEAFEKAFGTPWAEALKSGKVYNAMDAAAKLGLTPDELGAEFGKLKSGENLLKFGGGFYCGHVKDIFVINGFYMNMRSKFTAPGTCIHYYAVEWDAKELSWADFREKILGGTNPETAFMDSARHLIFSNWQGLGLTSCPNTSDNGVHASASPFEAMSERCNWLGGSAAKDFFGQAMVASGVPMETLMAWCEDPPVDFEGKKQSIFDLLEDMNGEDCLKKAGAIAAANK